MSPAWKMTKPRNDAEYFERMTKSVFNAGLSWTVVEKKWPNFRRSFVEFSPAKVARFSEKNVKALMNNDGIVRNEKKIRATIHNAGQFLRLEKEFGSVPAYLESFEKDEDRLQKDLQERFQHVGPSTARIYLWTVGYKLTPNVEEKKWMARHKSGK